MPSDLLKTITKYQSMTKEQFIKKLPTHIHILGDFSTRKVAVNGLTLRPEDSQKVRNHCPDGFLWGFGGAGPSQLALALLMMWVDADTALRHYQDLTHGYIAGLPQKNIDVHINLQWVMRTILQVGPFEAVKTFPRG
jgi:hypothetical protein